MKKRTLILMAILALIVVGCSGEGIVVPVQVPVEISLEVLDLEVPGTFEPQALERIGIRCTNSDRNCVEAWNGTDLVGYSDAGSTETYSIDAATGDFTSAGWLNLAAQTTVVVTDGTTGLVPTGTYQPVDAVATVGNIVTTTGFTAGDLLILANIGLQTITISDTGVMALSSDAALGPADSVTLVFSGTGWIEIGEGAN